MPARRPQRRRTPAPSADLAQRIGARLRVLRERKGMTQSELGAPYFTRSHVSAIEQGKTMPAVKTLVHFTRRLGLKRLRQLLPPDL